MAPRSMLFMAFVMLSRVPSKKNDTQTIHVIGGNNLIGPGADPLLCFAIHGWLDIDFANYTGTNYVSDKGYLSDISTTSWSDTTSTQIVTSWPTAPPTNTKKKVPTTTPIHTMSSIFVCVFINKQHERTKGIDSSLDRWKLQLQANAHRIKLYVGLNPVTPTIKKIT
eukprot:287379_1